MYDKQQQHYPETSTASFCPALVWGTEEFSFCRKIWPRKRYKNSHFFLTHSHTYEYVMGHLLSLTPWLELRECWEGKWSKNVGKVRHKQYWKVRGTEKQAAFPLHMFLMCAFFPVLSMPSVLHTYEKKETTPTHAELSRRKTQRSIVRRTVIRRSWSCGCDGVVVAGNKKLSLSSAQTGSWQHAHSANIYRGPLHLWRSIFFSFLFLRFFLVRFYPRCKGWFMIRFLFYFPIPMLLLETLSRRIADRSFPF